MQSGFTASEIVKQYDWCAGKGVLSSEKAFGMAIKIGVAGTQLIQYAGIALLLYFSLRKIVRDFREKDYVISRTELLFILAPSAVGMMVCMLLRIIMITLEDGVPKMLYERYPILIVVIPAILLLSLLSILYGVKLFQDMICWNREKSGRIVLENQISALQEHMEEMERIYSGIRGMKHDMKNTLAVIQRLSAGEGGRGAVGVPVGAEQRAGKAGSAVQDGEHGGGYPAEHEIP